MTEFIIGYTINVLYFLSYSLNMSPSLVTIFFCACGVIISYISPGFPGVSYDVSRMLLWGILLNPILRAMLLASGGKKRNKK